MPSRRNSTGSRERATTAAYDFLDMRTNSVVFKIPPRPSSHPPPPPRGSPRSGAVSGSPLASDNKTMEGRVNVMWKFLKAENKRKSALLIFLHVSVIIRLLEHPTTRPPTFVRTRTLFAFHLHSHLI